MKVSTIVIPLFFLCFSLLIPFVSAGKMIAGDISYHLISGLTYEFTVTIYQSTATLDSTITVNAGSGNSQLTFTSNTSAGTLCGMNVSKSSWVFTHTYPGNGMYSVYAFGSTRIDSIVNMSNSVTEDFTLQTTFIISPFIGINQTPTLIAPPIDYANIGVLFIHNLTATDIDGDSVTFQAMPTLGAGGAPVSGYTFPPASNSFSIDSVTGDIIWDSPQSVGYYSIGILIKEWRSGQIISGTTRDMLAAICQPNAVIELQSENEGINLSPNPASDNLIIETFLPENKSLTVYSLFGKIIFNQNFSGQKHSVDVSNLAQGIYFIEIKSERGILSKRFIKI